MVAKIIIIQILINLTGVMELFKHIARMAKQGDVLTRLNSARRFSFVRAGRRVFRLLQRQRMFQLITVRQFLSVVEFGRSRGKHSC